MSDLQRDLTVALVRAAERLRAARVPAETVLRMERMAQQVQQPCVVAVVGRVNAGKSTFINALLGQNLAKVGTTETTATINYFCYGQPRPERPVRCYWRSGDPTDESQAFLDSLQDNDIETLRRADAIERLEYHLQSPYLERAILVDTPGTQAVVSEHQERTAEFMQLYRQLQDRHNEQTQRIEGEADAVIYLIGATALAHDRDFLEEFQHSTGGRSRPLNAIGVLAKIDVNPTILEERGTRAARVAEQLHESLNTVVPVSAGLRVALDQLVKHDRIGLKRLMEVVRRIPAPLLTMMLRMDRMYLKPDLAGCPVSLEERIEIKGTMDWPVFATIVRGAADPSLRVEELEARLDGIAGFGPLKEVLERHFFKRGHFLRQHRIVSEALALIDTVRQRHLPWINARRRDDRARLLRFQRFLEQAPYDQQTAAELRAFVEEHLGGCPNLEATLDEIERVFGRIYYELQRHNADFQALQQMEEHVSLFSQSELDELRPLFGLYGMEAEKRLPPGRTRQSYVGQQQQLWMDVASLDPHPPRRDVAQQAVNRYGYILGDLLHAGSA